MTSSGAVCGNQRFGMYNYKQSVMMLASFERSGDTLFEAAYHNQIDHLKGASEAVIMGKPMKLGTGLFRLLAKENDMSKKVKRRDKGMNESDDEKIVNSFRKEPLLS